MKETMFVYHVDLTSSNKQRTEMNNSDEGEFLGWGVLCLTSFIAEKENIIKQNSNM